MIIQTLFRKQQVIISMLSVSCRYQSDLTIVSMCKGVKTITLNNPKKRNVLSSAMLEQLNNDIFKDIDDTNLRCIVLQSKGPVFSSGHDLKELHQSDLHKRKEIFQKCSELMMGLRKAPIPIVSVVNGLAAAAGCQLIASCDITVSSTKSHFSTPGASVGLFCSTPGIAVSRNVPLKIASYMLLTGNTLNASEAVQCGLVSKVVQEDDLDNEVEKILQAILTKSRSVLTLGKTFFYEQLDKELDNAYSLGSEVMVKNLAKEDAKEGITAFLEKRPPQWS